jgi:hypothetical protein
MVTVAPDVLITMNPRSVALYVSFSRIHHLSSVAPEQMLFYPGTTSIVRFEVFTAVTMKNAVFWDVPEDGILHLIYCFSVFIILFQDLPTKTMNRGFSILKNSRKKLTL